MMATISREDTLIAAHIEPHPHHPGEGEVRLKVEDGGVPVWVIIGATTKAGDNLAEVAHDYDVSNEAVTAAWAYYERHHAAIDCRLAENALA